MSQIETLTAIPFAETELGAVVLAEARYYEVPTTRAWEYIQDMGQIAAGRVPNFGLPGGLDLPPDVASVLHANATATTLGQVLAMGPEGSHEMLSSLLDFADEHGSIAGLESILLSTILTELHSHDGGLLARAEMVWNAVGGLEGVLSGEADLIPVVDGITGQFGFPSLETLQHVFDDPIGVGTEVVHTIKAPGHRIFDRVQSVLGTIDADAGSTFAEFRQSEVGQFVETVASVAIGIGLVAEAPIAGAIKVGSAVVEGAVTFISGIFDAVFGSSDDENANAPEPPNDHDKVQKGEHAVVGCWVEEEIVVDDTRIPEKVEDGSCPDPDLQQPIPFPMPDEPGGWPTEPRPVLGGPGLGKLFQVEDSDAYSLAFSLDQTGLLELDAIVPELGWDEDAYEGLIEQLDILSVALPDRLDALITRAWTVSVDGGDLEARVLTGEEGAIGVLRPTSPDMTVGVEEVHRNLIIPNTSWRAKIVSPGGFEYTSELEYIVGQIATLDAAVEQKYYANVVDLVTAWRDDLAAIDLSA
ncbi:hypothetical protein [Myceligenerans pegani]|uniref:Uncharacterized protein n=1 Tax=Myceligenerans pegani TaxID=2776917 RepID=A0ABR9N0X2_9MICO|nr:hypothetical protein [Myceligenerans sp. TRM 65318]MBE1877307.1 hypothetical protein [Myceligenerans sp. TRM 65318]MBE3019578.1 hypothetical protein [Myceligenerans sp. TRM 65318]